MRHAFITKQERGHSVRGMCKVMQVHPSGFYAWQADPGKPWQNGTDESFNGKFRDECLSLEWFRSRREAVVIIEAWRRHYNAVRPHSSLDYLTLNEFKEQDRPVPTPAVLQE